MVGYITVGKVVLFHFSTPSMFGQETEKVLEIKKRPNLRAEEKTIYDSIQHQDHDVEIYRTSWGEGRSYHFTFYLGKDDTPKNMIGLFKQMVIMTDFTVIGKVILF